jgi:type VI secretion system VasD/TssJ family lipoprotein
MQGPNCMTYNALISRHRSITAVVLVFLASSLSGCGLLQKFGILSGPEIPPAPAIEIPVPLSEQPLELQLTVTASSDLNPDTQSRPSPVQLRVFLTDGKSELTGKSFEEVFDIGGNAIQPRPLATITLRPGQSRDLVLPANKTLTTLIVAAAYRDPYQAIWLGSAVLPAADNVSATATLSTAVVTINDIHTN